MLLLTAIPHTSFGQPPAFEVVNKTDCEIYVQATCSGASTFTQTIASHAGWNSSCPTSEHLCYVRFEFTSSSADPSTTYNSIISPVMLCGSNDDLNSDGCWLEDTRWQLIATKVQVVLD